MTNQTDDFEVGDRVTFREHVESDAEGRVAELMGDEVLVNFDGFPRRVLKANLKRID